MVLKTICSKRKSISEFLVVDQKMKYRDSYLVEKLVSFILAFLFAICFGVNGRVFVTSPGRVRQQVPDGHNHSVYRPGGRAEAAEQDADEKAGGPEATGWTVQQ